jgi:hypothetical protein
MLRTDLQPATRFLDSTPLSHHIYNDRVKRLRKQYLASLREDQPRFVVTGRVQRPGGPGTRARWEGLDEILDRHYRAVHRGKGFILWERRGKGKRR